MDSVRRDWFRGPTGFCTASTDAEWDGVVAHAEASKGNLRLWEILPMLGISEDMRV